MTRADALAIAQQKHRERDYCLAEMIYGSILHDDPNDEGALQGLGILLRQTGRREAAEEYLRRAVSLNSESVGARRQLASVLFEMGRWPEASDEYGTVLRIAPRDGPGWNNLGLAQAAQGNMLEAEACFRRALELNPNHFEALSNLANAVAGSNHSEEAAELCRRILALQPKDPQARFLWAALSGEDAPPRAPRSYVAQIYNAYADRFDDQLIGELGYRGPHQLREVFEDVPGSKALEVMDLGCGTGLCGLAFRDLARTLTGVDLSNEMLQRAQARQIYDKLILGDLCDALLTAPAEFDLLVAADVFIYFGDLAPVFAAARSALRDAGRFAFLTEAHEGDGFILRPSRRYAHSTAYIRALASSLGFAEIAMRQVALRLERDQVIEGVLHLFRSSRNASNGRT